VFRREESPAAGVARDAEQPEQQLLREVAVPVARHAPRHPLDPPLVLRRQRRRRPVIHRRRRLHHRPVVLGGRKWNVDGRFGAGRRGSELRECPRFRSHLFIARREKSKTTCGSSPCIDGLGQITRFADSGRTRIRRDGPTNGGARNSCHWVTRVSTFPTSLSCITTTSTARQPLPTRLHASWWLHSRQRRSPRVRIPTNPVADRTLIWGHATDEPRPRSLLR
jgi:hypothetical protein